MTGDVMVVTNPDNQIGKETRSKAATCYVPFIGWIISAFFILTERENHFLRFNALQSILTHVVLIGLYFFLVLISFFVSLDPITKNPIILVLPLYLIISLFLLYKVYNGKKYLFLRIGAIAEKNL